MTTLPTSASARVTARLHFRAWRRFLTRNEIFFKTIAATVFTVVSLFFGWLQVKNSEQQGFTAKIQNDLAQTQMRLAIFQSQLAETQVLPSFEIRIKQETGPVSGRADTNVLTIENSGGPVREFAARAIFFAEFTVGEKKIPYPKVQLRIRITDYYHTSMVTAASKGNLVSIFDRDNNLELSTFARALSASAESQNWLYANTEERTFVHIHYLDILNREHEEYYEVEPVRGSKLISDAIGRAMFDEAATRGVSRRDLTVEKISRDIAELMKAQPR